MAGLLIVLALGKTANVRDSCGEEHGKTGGALCFFRMSQTTDDFALTELFGNFSFRTTSAENSKIQGILQDLFGNCEH